MAALRDEQPDETSLVGCRLLVVDDEQTLVDLLTSTFEDLGAEVLSASSAEAARHLLDASPDLALVDVNLGGSSGFDFLEELRRTSCIPVIMLTGLTAEKYALRGLELGADDYVRKPFSIRELVARVERRILRG